MAGITIKLSIITLLMVSIVQSKDKYWWIRSKNKAQPFVVYKKHTSLTNTGIM
jgi:hypothetical protein